MRHHRSQAGCLLAVGLCLAGCTYRGQAVGFAFGSGSGVTAVPSAAAANGLEAVALTISLRRADGSAAGGTPVQCLLDDPNDTLVVNGVAWSGSPPLDLGADGRLTATLASVVPGDKTVRCTAAVDGGAAHVALPPLTVRFVAVPPGPSLALQATPAAPQAGLPFALTVTALAAPAQVARAFVGQVTLSASDPAAVLPPSVAFGPTAGGQVQVPGLVLCAAGPATLGAAVAGSPAIVGTLTLQVGAGPAAAFRLSVPYGTQAGTRADLTVEAIDRCGNVATDYVGTVTLGASDGVAVAAGTQAVFTAADLGSVLLPAAFEQDNLAAGLTVTADDGALSSTQSDFGVGPAAPKGLAVSALPTALPSGSTTVVTVVAEDAYGNPTPTWQGAIALRGNDPRADGLPVHVTLDGDDGGRLVVNVTPRTVQTTTLTAADAGSGLAAGSTALLVSASGPYLTAAWDPNGSGTGTGTIPPAGGGTDGVSATAGSHLGATLTVHNQDGSVATAFAGSVALSLSDPNGLLGVAQVTLQPSDQGSRHVGDLVSFHTAGTQYLLMATSVGGAAIGGTSAPVTVRPAAPAGFALNVAQPLQAGQAAPLHVMAQDAFGNPSQSYVGTLHVALSDPAATPPPDHAVAAGDQGAATLPLTLLTATGGGAGTTVTVADANSSSLSGSLTVAVQPGPLSGFSVTVDANAATAGVPFGAVARAVDAYANTVPSFTGSVAFTSSDANATLPPSTAFSAADAGVHSFPGAITLRASGRATLTVGDGQGHTGSLRNIPVAGGAAAAWQLAAPGGGGAAVAGQGVALQLTLVDAFGNPTADARTAHFGTDDPNAAGLPADANRQGSAAVTVTLFTAGSRSLTVGSPAAQQVQAASLTLPVAAAAAASLRLAVTPTPAPAGTAVSAAVTALDAFANVAVGYAGSVQLGLGSGQSSDAVLPAAAAFTAADAGTHTFSGVRLLRTDSMLLQATDTANAHLTGQLAVPVVAADPNHLDVTFAAQQTAGSPNDVTVTVRDAYNNVVKGYAGTVSFTSNDAFPATHLPAATAFVPGTDRGSHTWAGGVVLTQARTGTFVQATDSLLGASGRQAGITVSAAAPARLVASGPGGVLTAGSATTVTVTAQDAYGNTAPTYSGAVVLQAPQDPQYGPATVVNIAAGSGSGSGSVTLKTAGAQVVNPNDSRLPFVAYSTTVQSTGVTASLAFAVQPPAGVPACTPIAPPVQVRYLDAYGNPVAQNGNTITVAASTAFGPVTLAGTLGQVPSAGVAVFDDLSFTSKQNFSVTLKATGSGRSVSSNSVTVGAPAALGVALGSPSVSGSAVALPLVISGACGAPVDIAVVAGNANARISLTAASPQGVHQTPTLGGNPTLEWDSRRDLPRFAGQVALQATVSVAGKTASGSTSVALDNGVAYGAPAAFGAAAAVLTVGTADLDGDGRGDLVYGDGVATRVALGGAAQAVAYPSGGGAGPTALALGDVDHDGDVDVVGCINSSTASGLYLQRGRGDGTLAAATAIAGSGSCTGALLADVDHDGSLDALSFVGQALRVARGGGDGTFAAPTSVALGMTPAAGAVAADFTGDGLVDVAVAQQGGPTVALFTNSGGALAAASSSRATPGGQSFVLGAGDLNGDGRLDLLALGDQGLQIFAAIGGQGDLGAAVPQAQVVGAALVAADLDGDGDLDVACGDANGVRVALGSRTLSLAAPTGAHAGAALAATSLALGNMTRDGRLDLAVGTADHRAAWLPNVQVQAGSLQLAASRATPVAATPTASVAADIDEDGKTDVAFVASANGTGVVAWLKGDGAAGFAGAPSVLPNLPAGTFGRPTAADFDGDGHVDLAVPTRSADRVVLLRGDGAGNFAVSTGSGLGGSGSSHDFVQAVAADVNVDGTVDLLLLDAAVGRVAVIAGPVQSNLNTSTQVTMQATAAHDLAVGNLDGNGRPDLVVGTAGNSNTVWVALNAGSGTFGAARPYSTGINLAGIALVDLDRDGKLDLATVDATNNRVWVAGGGGDGTFGSPTYTALPCTPTGLVSADFDGKNGPDLALSCTGGLEALLVARNDGSGGLAGSVIEVPLLAGPQAPLLVDLDSDGFADVVTAAPAAGALQASIDAPARSGGFWGAGPLAVGAPTSVAVGDADRDGSADAVVAHGTTLDVRHGNGDGSLGSTPSPALPISAGAAPLLLADVNGDGAGDLLAGEPGRGPPAISLALSQTAPGASGAAFAAPAATPLAAGPAATVAIDLDNDGDLDAVVAVAGNANGLAVVRFDAAVNGLDPNGARPYAASNSGSGVAAGDLNRDGWADVVLADSENGQVVVLLNDGRGGLGAPRTAAFTGRPGPGPLALADLDGDGDLDLVALRQGTSSAAPQVTSWLGDGQGNFSGAANVALAGVGPGTAAVRLWLTDLDGDGDPDLVVPAGGTLGTAVLACDPSLGGRFAAPLLYVGGPGALDVGVADFNHDGRPDLLLVDDVGGQLSVAPGL